MPLRIIFIDLNSYFASVEQAERPELMGRPVAVVPMMAETTCCLAASYPAKACGVQTGTLVGEARKLCPRIIFVQADHRKYVSYHHKILKAVEKCLPIWKIFSIDEMAVRLFGREQNFHFAYTKALEIKKRILEEVHPALTCSIGIAPNRFIAKIASDMQKPDGLVVIDSEELPERLCGLRLRDFPGIGARMEKRLLQSCCFSVRELCEKSPEQMRRLWGGRLGEDMWRLIRGEDLEELETQRRSISHSRVLSPETRTPEHAWAHLVALVSKAAMRLREEGFYARSLQLNLKFLVRKQDSWEREAQYWDGKTHFFETQDTQVFLQALSDLWRSVLQERAPKKHIFKVGVVLSGLVPAERHQLSFWENTRREKLMQAIDKLNKLHRKNLVVYAESRALHTPSHAPIAFGHIPELYE